MCSCAYACEYVCLFFFFFFYNPHICWYLSIIVIFLFLLEIVQRSSCTVYMLRYIDIPFLPTPSSPLTSLHGWTLPWAIHPSSPSHSAPLPANCSSPYDHMTDRGAGRWNRMLTIRHPERDGSNQGWVNFHSGSNQPTLPYLNKSLSVPHPKYHPLP